MIRRLVMSLSLVLLAAVAVAPATLAQDKLEGTANWTFNECYPGPPNEEIPIWIGTIDFDGEVYDALSWNVGTGRPYGHMPAEGYMPFNEVFVVYRDLELVLGPECTVEQLEGDVLMWGHDGGLTDTATAEYSAIGFIMEASEGFDGLAGSPMSMSGTIVFGPDGVPLSASGPFDIG